MGRYIFIHLQPVPQLYDGVLDGLDMNVLILVLSREEPIVGLVAFRGKVSLEILPESNKGRV